MSDEVKSKSRRRPRRRRPAKKDDAQQTASGAKSSKGRGRRRPKQKKGPARSVARASSVDTDRPADEALSAEEVADMRRHLAFIRRFRAPLRLKLNAREDLLVNGSQDPDHRGTCKHLLSKVDRSTVTAALAREPLHSNAKQRAEFLAGAAAISGDVGILLSYLESLSSVASQDVAAQAFSVTVQRIDFESISAARMVRLLEIVEATFSGYGKVQAMFGLLQSESFRRAFDASIAAIDAEQASRFLPLRAVWETLERSRRGGRRRGPKPPRAALEAGLRELLSAPPAVLRGYPDRTRERLLDVLLTSQSGWPYEHAGVRRLLDSLPDEGALFRRHGFLCARGLVRQEKDSEAKTLLRRVATAHKDFRAATDLLEWLDRPTLGRYALQQVPGGKGPQSVQRAYCLSRFRFVWLRWGRPEDRDRLLAEAEIHSRLGVPGVAPLLDSGLTGDGRPFLAADATLERLSDRMAGARKRPSLELALSLVQSGVAICRMLAALGVTLPDAKPERFLADLRAERPHLELVDLRGAKAVPLEEAASGMAVQAAKLVKSAFLHPPFRGDEWRRDLPHRIRERLQSWQRNPPELRAMGRELAEIEQSFSD